MNTDRREWIRRQAITIFELTKGFTPEQRQNFSNELTSLEEMSGYVLELTDQLKQRDETIKELKEALKDMYKAIEYGELELRTTYERFTSYKGSSSLWNMQNTLKKYTIQYSKLISDE